MKARVTIHSPSGSSEIELEEGRTVRIGSSREVECQVPDDSLLAGEHFSLSWDGKRCLVRDLGSIEGTYHRCYRILETEMSTTEPVLAGRTYSTLRLEDEVGEIASSEGRAALPTAGPATPKTVSGRTGQEPPLPPSRQRLLEILSASPVPLFAVLDAARDLRICDWLRSSEDPYECLYEGQSAVDLEMFAPYLVRLAPSSSLLRDLVAQAWGMSWGVYLTCAEELSVLRRHFRHLLLVEVASGRRAYFRFYDPRVLRLFLAVCSPDEAEQLFGPVGTFLVEAENPSRLLRYHDRKRPGTPDLVSLGHVESPEL